MRPAYLGLIAALAVWVKAGASLACVPLPDLGAAHRISSQREMLAGASNVYLARVSAVQESPSSIDTTFALIVALKGGEGAVASVTSRQMLTCPTHAYPAGSLVILYTGNAPTDPEFRGHAVPVSETVNPEIVTLLGEAAERLRELGRTE